MDQSTLFISSMTLVVSFSAFIVALNKVINVIERHYGNLGPRRPTYQYERYSQELCGCLATVGLVEIILIGISLSIMDHEILKMCDYHNHSADCNEIAVIWHTIIFTYWGVTVLIACILVASLARVIPSIKARPRRLCFQPMILMYGHLLLQFCALLILAVTCSDFIFQKVTMATKRDACIIIAAWALFTFEISVSVWLYGTTTFCVEIIVLASRRRNPQARVQGVGVGIGLDLEDQSSTSDVGP